MACPKCNKKCYNVFITSPAGLNGTYYSYNLGNCDYNNVTAYFSQTTQKYIYYNSGITKWCISSTLGGACIDTFSASTSLGQCIINDNKISECPQIQPVVNSYSATNECEVITYPQLVATCSVIQPSYPFANDGSVTLTISGGTAPYLVKWGTNDVGTLTQNTVTINNKPAGIYTATITDFFQNFIVTTSCELINPPCILSATTSAVTQTPMFVSVWKTTTPNETITLPYSSIGLYTGTIDWGDGQYDNNDYANRTHTYTSPGTHIIKIDGYVVGWNFDTDSTPPNETKIYEIKEWGLFGLSGDSEYAFANCVNLSMSGVTDIMDTSFCSGFYHTFENCTSLKNVRFMELWDTSNLQTLEGCFSNCVNFNHPIGSWVTSAVTNMSYVFSGASNFNQDLSGWTTTSVLTTQGMFYNASKFNKNIDNWDVSNVGDMSYMFVNSSLFNQPLSSWNVSGVTDMKYMFSGANTFNQIIGTWNIQQVGDFDNFMATRTSSGSSIFLKVYLDSIYNGWSTLPSVLSGINISFGTAKYNSSSQAGKNILTGTYFWTITDGGT